VGWHSENSDIGSGREPHPVGLKLPNQFGIHDMHGNVLEYVEDYYFEDFYAQPEAAGPDPLATNLGGPPGSTRTCEGNTQCAVSRGGKWERNTSCGCSSESEARSAYRAVNAAAAGAGSGINGFRLALPLPKGPGPEFDCTDGVDDDGDGDTDCDDFECFEDAGCVFQETICGDGQDNDGDGLVDCDDCDCNCTPDAIPGFTVEPCNAQGYREWTHTQTGMRLVMLAGTGLMGGQSADPWDWNYDPRSQRFLVNADDATRWDTRNEGPVHRVTLSPYLIGKYEVTQGAYKGVTGSNPSSFRNDSTAMPPKTDCSEGAGDDACDDHPVDNVRWVDLYEAAVNPSTEKGFIADTNLSLPTEAQWEYACRAGQPGPFSGTGNLDEMGWFNTNTETHDVGLKLPNQFGIHDMHGNVNEWVRDEYDPAYYSNSPALDPFNEVPAADAVYRGGWYGTDGSGRTSRPISRSAARITNSAAAGGSTQGFRAAFYPIPGR
jgi:formylglycine-generating enzyme required for sulfatase activity